MIRELSTLAFVLLLSAGAAAQQARDPLVSIDQAIAAAEAALRAGELQIAESRYRSALFEAWMTSGGLHVAAGRLADARDAFRAASRSIVDADVAFRSLALIHLQLREASEAVGILTKLSARAPADPGTKRLLAQALVANGQPEEAVQTLEEARAAAPEDPETAFLLASGYLNVKKLDAAERLFAEVAAAHPIAETWVLIGRTYRDFRMFEQARSALRNALKKDPRVRRAHYYLGTAAVLEEGVVRVDEAIREFREELKVAPDDAATHLRLGMALVEARREQEALAVLQKTTRSMPTAAVFHYLGRAQLALGQSADAVDSFRRALQLATDANETQARIGHIHYQLAQALRQAGAAAESAQHFKIARKASSQRAENDRAELDRYLADTADDSGSAAAVPLDSPFSSLPATARDDMARRVRTSLARAYLNLGIMRVQKKEFAQAAELLEQGAAVDPDFPQLQYSLGVAHFNAQQYERAAAALTRARAGDATNDDLRRMLALAHLNAGAYERAAELLTGDARTESDPSLQYAYGLALARSGRAAEAQGVFNRLLEQHGDRAEVHVILGQAYAQEGDFDAAIQSLQRARQLNPNVSDAGATLGMIHLKQGKLADAAAALRDELRANPDNLNARHTLATVLDLEGQSEQAVALLRAILAKKPDFGDARYLLGKILVSQGESRAAIPHLEAAVRLSPDDATYHYQLAQAYRKDGNAELADKHLALFRELKDKRRGGDR